ncbi:MAG: hypothetical protein ACI9XO_001669 [Paraglaciecola sp.]|jgi:hypothetical protein
MKNWTVLWMLFLIMGCQSQESPDGFGLISASDEEYLKDVTVHVSDWETEFPEHSLLTSGTTNANQLAYHTPPPPPQTNQSPKKAKPKIIKTATINMELADYEADDQRIRDLVKMVDGYISSEDQKNQYYQMQNTMVVRLSPEKLDNFLHQLKKIGKKVLNHNVNSKDVTKEFLDMEIRIKSKEEVIARYRELLKKAKTVEEILQVENELRVVIEELESVKGQLNYLKNQIGLSTVTIQYFMTKDQPGAEKPGFFSNIGEAIGDGWYGLKNFVIGMVTIWPFLIIMGFIGYFLRHFLRRRRRRENKA